MRKVVTVVTVVTVVAFVSVVLIWGSEDIDEWNEG